MISTADGERVVRKCGEDGRDDVYWLRQSYDGWMVSSVCGPVDFFRVYHWPEGVTDGKRMAKIFFVSVLPDIDCWL